MREQKAPKLNLTTATKEDLCEMHGFLRAARIASVGAGPTKAPSMWEHLRLLVELVEQEMKHREVKVPALETGERIYAEGCRHVDADMIAA